MRVHVIRHAIAEPRDAGWVEEERPLTPKGIDRLERAVAGLARIEVSIDRLFTSPWTRAAQTAARLGSVAAGQPVPTELLADAPSEELLELLGGGESVGVVGHEPWLGELVAWLTVGDPAEGGSFPLKKAGVVILEGPCAPGMMELRASLPPRVLRTLSK